jgi:hydroxypyruvate isomerase
MKNEKETYVQENVAMTNLERAKEMLKESDKEYQSLLKELLKESNPIKLKEKIYEKIEELKELVGKDAKKIDLDLEEIQKMEDNIEHTLTRNK